MADLNLTQARLKEVVHYDPDTGHFTWLRPTFKNWTGKRADHRSPRGYMRMGIDGSRYMAHVLAWLYVNGVFPDDDIDHINRNKGDNRLCNLRVVSRSLNSLNKDVHHKNKSGHTGVIWHKKAEKWMVYACGKYQGLYADMDTAAMARERIVERMFANAAA
jgi:hypothetical protein